MREADRNTMVELQLKKRGISNEAELFAMRHVPRHIFVPEDRARMAYEDFAIPIGYSQTISQPYIVAQMIELLDPDSEDKVLEVGSGSGYACAVLSRLCSKVVGVESVPELVEKSKQALKELKILNVRIVKGDGSQGEMHYQPYDKILISAACPAIPGPLLEQLRVGGIIVAPVGERLHQKITKVVKGKDGVTETLHGDCVFVPLTGKSGFKL